MQLNSKIFEAFWTTWAWILFVTLSVTRAQVPFRLMARGVVQNADIVSIIGSSMECFFLCKTNKVCSAFSITISSNLAQLIECRIALGFFSWAPDDNSSLFLEYDKTILESHAGYTFQPDGKFYRFYNTSSKYVLTRVRCETEGGTVAVPYPELAQNVIRSVAPSNASFAIGITRLSSSEGYWVTYDGETFNDTDSTSNVSQKWISGRPTNPGINASCTENVPPSYSWENLDCSSDPRNYSTFCRKTVGYRKANNGKFYKLRRASTPINFAVAASLCASEGAVLAVPYPLTEFKALEGFMAALWNMVTYRIAVAGTDAAQEDIWVMPNRLQFDARNQTDPNQVWAAGRPNGGSGSNCLAIANAAFVDVNCTANTVYRFVCQKTWP